MRAILKKRMGYNGSFAIRQTLMGATFLRNEVLNREEQVEPWQALEFARANSHRWAKLCGMQGAKEETAKDEPKRN